MNVVLVLEKLGIEGRTIGGRIWAERCPLPSHQQHNPQHRYQNFFVRAHGERAGQYHCFSCGGGGRLVDLVMNVRGFELRDALAWLRNVEEQAPAVPFLRVRVAAGPRAFRLPDGVEGGPLAEWNSQARQYVERRGITAGQVERWRIGYSLMGRLAGRIVFPVLDGAGRVVNYTGRTFVEEEPRYMAASEREHPDTSALWGEHQWHDRITALVVEGAINGLAFERALAGIVLSPDRVDPRPNIAGLSGSDFDHRKAMRLSEFRRVVVATDPDQAGDDAFEDIWAALHRGCRVERFVHPTKEDAAATPVPALQEALWQQVFR